MWMDQRRNAFGMQDHNVIPNGFKLKPVGVFLSSKHSHIICLVMNG